MSSCSYESFSKIDKRVLKLHESDRGREREVRKRADRETKRKRQNERKCTKEEKEKEIDTQRGIVEIISEKYKQI